MLGADVSTAQRALASPTIVAVGDHGIPRPTIPDLPSIGALLAAFEEAGARVIRLGPHVLRSSSAGPAALAVLLARARW